MTRKYKANFLWGKEAYAGIQVEKMKKESMFEYMTWKMFDSSCSEIETWGRTKKFTGIYGIPRGGLVLAVRLSYSLNIPLILSKEDISPTVLVVDDVSDSGETLLPFKKNMIATLYYKKGSQVKPNKWVYEKTNKWVIFPWEI